MGSDLPKVLHLLGGRALVEHPLGVLRTMGVERVVLVIGHGAERVREVVTAAALADAPGWIRFVVQEEQNGTGHAVLCALPELAATGQVAILSGDVPLLRAETLAHLAGAQATASSGLALATFRPTHPSGYGRVLRDAEGTVVAIQEERDATVQEKAIEECNAGIYCAEAALLHRELPRLGAANAQGEIYLTDLVGVAARAGAVAGMEVGATEVAGVNTPDQLRELEALVAARS